MARAPSSAGKTRLVPHLSAPRLAALRAALLADTLHTVAALPDIAPVVFFTPPDAEPEIAALAERPLAAVPQAEGDLGERMRSAFDHLLADRERAVLVGADMPFLTADHIADALAALRTSGGVVLGPADDGGYYLIGMSEVHAGLFERIAWGADRVLSDTLRAADRLGIEARLIRNGYDVDTIEDLRRLERDLSGAPPGIAPHVRGWFSERS
jgi:rSAM/selenodomain-associated transferase 1